jgi:hypothetical protein
VFNALTNDGSWRPEPRHREKIVGTALWLLKIREVRDRVAASLAH